MLAHLYGMSVLGLDAAAAVEDEPPPGWPMTRLMQAIGLPPSEQRIIVTDSVGQLEVPRLGTLAVRRDPRSIMFTAAQRLPDGLIVHPLLAFAAAVLARWDDRSAFHAAALLLGGQAWLLLGEPGAGKTSLAWQHHVDGDQVLSEDLSVIGSGMVFAGPRVADLRTGAADHFGLGGRLIPDVGRPRYRQSLGSAPWQAPLGGFIELAWSERLGAAPVPVTERLGLLARHEALGLGPSGHRGFLDLLAAPMWRLVRPQAWASLEQTAALVRRIAHEADS